VNEYIPGQGIMPHEDGGAYYPVTVTVSLGSHCVLNVYEKLADGEEQSRDGEPEVEREAGRRRPEWRVLCEPRSLLVTTGRAYAETLHGIDHVKQDEGVRPTSTADGDGVVNWGLLGEREIWEKAGGSRVRETRVSLTYRDVLKVKSLKGFGPFGNMGRK